MKSRITTIVCLMMFAVLTSLASAAESEKKEEKTIPVKEGDNAVTAGIVKPAAPKFANDDEKISYIIGVQLGESFKAQDLNISAQLLARGIMDVFSGSDLAIPKEEHQAILQAYQNKMREKMEKERDEMEAKMKEEGEKQLGDKAWKLNLKKPEKMTFDANKDYLWVLQTNKGKITIKLWPDVAPMHVSSTIFLTKKGFYDGIKFHRVIPEFMAQGGCPLGTGTGGPGYEYDGEFKDDVKHDKPYLLSMANRGPGTDGSQFFLTFKATPWLDGKHTIFGEIIEGKDVMAKFEEAGTPSGKPKEELSIEKATIVEKDKNQP